MSWLSEAILYEFLCQKLVLFAWHMAADVTVSVSNRPTEHSQSQTVVVERQ